MRPPLRLGEFAMPKYEIITLPETHLIGTTQSYSCSLEQISEFRHQMRVQFWRDFLSHAPPFRRSCMVSTKRIQARKKTTSRRCSTPPR
jgi:hypothetical protein